MLVRISQQRGDFKDTRESRAEGVAEAMSVCGPQSMGSSSHKTFWPELETWTYHRYEQERRRNIFWQGVERWGLGAYKFLSGLILFSQWMRKPGHEPVRSLKKDKWSKQV